MWQLIDYNYSRDKHFTFRFQFTERNLPINLSSFSFVVEQRKCLLFRQLTSSTKHLSAKQIRCCHYEFSVKTFLLLYRQQIICIVKRKKKSNTVTTKITMCAIYFWRIDVGLFFLFYLLYSIAWKWEWVKLYEQQHKNHIHFVWH